MKLILATSMIFVFSTFAFAQEQESRGLGTGNMITIAKAICEGKTTAIPEEKWPEFCIQYHEMMAGYYHSQAIIHESCTKKPSMRMCKKEAGASRLE